MYEEIDRSNGPNTSEKKTLDITSPGIPRRRSQKIKILRKEIISML
jgi:hypothetical protein